MMTGKHVSRLLGYAPALPTPFNQDGDVDGAAFERLCDRQIQEGATALVVCGSTGEAPTLSRVEHDRIVRMAIGVAHGRVPVIAGVRSNATSQAVELARMRRPAAPTPCCRCALLATSPCRPACALISRDCRFGRPADLPPDVPSRTVCGLAGRVRRRDCRIFAVHRPDGRNRRCHASAALGSLLSSSFAVRR